MKHTKLLFLIFSLGITGCLKEGTSVQISSSIPNGNFEIWDGWNLKSWTSDSCPACTQQILTCILIQSNDAISGRYAAELLSNGAFPSYIENKFQISYHPISLNGYIKTNLDQGDTVLVQIKLLNNHNVVDSGKWEGTKVLSRYTQITIPITKTTSKVDSACIYIRGGKKNPSTILWVDNFTLTY